YTIPLLGMVYVLKMLLEKYVDRLQESAGCEFEGLATRGKTSMGWFYGFKLHLIVNDEGELLAFRLTPGNVDDRAPVPQLVKTLVGQLFGDRGYISQALHDALLGQGLELLTKIRKNMKNRVMRLWDKLLLRKRSLIETINDQLVVFQKWRWPFLHRPSKGIAVDK